MWNGIDDGGVLFGLCDGLLSKGFERLGRVILLVSLRLRLIAQGSAYSSTLTLLNSILKDDEMRINGL